MPWSGQILADIIQSGAVVVVRLIEVFRPAAQSRIITTTHRINQGSITPLGPPSWTSKTQALRFTWSSSKFPVTVKTELHHLRTRVEFGPFLVVPLDPD